MRSLTEWRAAMRIGWRFAIAVPALVGSLAAVAVADAPAPVNDDYLRSLRLEDAHHRTPRHATLDVQDTSAATVQGDMLAPAGSGGGAEPTSCRGVSYGRTIWYDITPDQHGAIRVQSAGRDGVIALYEYDRRTLRLGKRVRCVNEPGLQDELNAWLDKGKSYTVQLGGVDDGAGPAGGQVQFTEQFLDDGDRDDVIDAVDKCVGTKGSSVLKGCLAELVVTPTFNWTRYTDGVKIDELSVIVAGRGGGKATAWRSGGRRFEYGLRHGKASFTEDFEQHLPFRSRLTLTVTRPGAIAEHFSWEITGDGVGTRHATCLVPKTHRPPRHGGECQ